MRYMNEPVIPGGVELRPGIQEWLNRRLLDSGFRRNDWP